MTNLKRKIVLPLIVIILLISGRSVLSFEIDGSKWIGSKADVYVYLEGKSASGISWNEAFLDAVSDWNLNTPFSFNPISKYLNPCVADGLNGVDFVKDLCGTGFGKSTIAVTVRRYKPQVLGPPAIVEADIYLNSNISFDVFDGAGPFLEISYSQTKDFRRVVLHELGHVIGLDHEDTKEAIMQPEYGEVFKLQEDDIAGVKLLYGGLSNCKIQALRLGNSNDSLSSSDCTVKQLTVGGSDESLIDIYSFALNSPTEVSFSVTSPELEAVIIIADSNLNYIANDSTIGENCGADLKTKLPSGNYFLLVNTFDRAVRALCEVVGQYTLSVGYRGPDAQALGPTTSSRGQGGRATFSGKITADHGKSFGNKFTPEDSLDISATISIDPIHRNEEGFIVVAAVIGNKILLLNEKGSFVDSELVPGPLISHEIKNLEAVEVIQIFSNLIAAEFGISQIAVDFFVGYGLLAIPTEIFFHETPLNLIISPSDK